MVDRETSGGELSDIPNEHYVKFFAKFDEIHKLKVEQWKPVHFVAYFCHLFNGVYGTPYQFKYNSPSPSKCFEIFQIKKLGQVLSTQPVIIRDYINWIFDKKSMKEKVRFRSISFLTREDILKEYKLTVLLSSKIDRTASLPKEVLIAIDQQIEIKIMQGEFKVSPLNKDFRTYNDAAFLSKIPDHPAHRMVMDILDAYGITKKLETLT